MRGLMPYTTTATELQRNYRKVVKKAKKLREAMVVLSNNKPEGVYMDYETYKSSFKPSKKAEINKTSNNDFSEFSGLWTKKEAEQFDKIIEDAFEQINPEDWK